MKVFMCERQGGYSGGLAVVAANSKEEARKLIADSFKSYDIRDRIDAAIKEFHGWGEKPLKTEIARELANRILEKVEIKIQ